MIDGVQNEPYEELTIELDSSFIGIITEEMGKRRAEMIDSHTNSKGMSRMIYRVSSRNLLGFRTEILTKTRGNGIFASSFSGYFKEMPQIEHQRNGVLVATENGMTTAYAINAIQNRGQTFVGPGVMVYPGQIIGQNAKAEDIDVNICKGKQITNVRTTSSDGTIKIAPPIIMSLEECLNFIEDDELLEVTPKSLRLRKKILDKNLRHKSQK